MVPKKDASVVFLALLVALSAAPRAASFTSPLALSASTISLPSAVPSGTTVRVDGSDSMSAISQFLKQAFERQYAGTTVNLATDGTDAALRSLLAGQIDLAAVARQLTPQEKAQGLTETILSREKIAIIVGANNPVRKSLTDDQFAAIFRGQITNWSQVGGPNLPIRLIDRPDTSDTRSALRNYPVFRSAPFQTGKTATQVAQDSTAEIVSQLGRDGISYAIVSQVSNLPNVRILPMHNTLPTNPRYPFSQPRGYVYRQSASPAVAAFLRFAASPAGQAAIAAARLPEGAIATAPARTAATPAAPAAGIITPTATATPSAATALVATTPTPVAASPDPTPIANDTASESSGLPGWLWLLPLLLLGGLAWWLLGRRRSTAPIEPERPAASPPAATSVPLAPNAGSGGDTPRLATRAESIIASDRATRSTSRNDIDPNSSEPPVESEPPVADPINPLGAAAIAGGALFGAGAIADAMHEASEETEPVLDVTPDDEVAAVQGENYNTVLSETPNAPLYSDNTILQPDALADDPLAPPVVPADPELPVETMAASSDSAPVEPIETVADPWTIESPSPVEPPIDPLMAAALTNAIAEPTEEPNVAPAPPSAELDASNFAAELPNTPLTAPEIPPAAESIDAPEVIFNAASIEPDEAEIVDAASIESVGDVSELTIEPEPTLESIDELEVVILDPLPIESVGDIDELTLMPEPIIEPIDEPSAIEAELIVISPADAIDLTDADAVTPEAAMLDAIVDEAEESPLPEFATAESEPSTDLSEQVILAGGAALAAGGVSMLGGDRAQSTVEAARFDVGATDDPVDLAAVDEDLPDLPEGYGDSRIVLMPRDPQWAYAYWDVPNDHKQALRDQGGSRFALRLYDVTDLALTSQRPHSLQQYECDELARDWYLAIPVSDRDYIAEIGYVTEDGRWLMLARSAPVRVPPVYPSDWFEDQFLSVEWEEELQGKTFLELIPPEQKAAIAAASSPIYSQIFDLAESIEMQRIAGSLFGSMQQVPQQAISSFVFPSGVGQWAAPFELLPLPSGIGMSGMGMSGVGFSASVPPIRPRQFWLVADAELIVYGATEPDAIVTIGGRPIKLNPDGTFRFQISFQDGSIDYPIMAVAADGEQTRSIHMEFTRETPERNTNTKDEAIDE